jgi:anti-sigma factor RsiW
MMNGKEHDPGLVNDGPLACHDCRDGLQEYLDGTLVKQQSLRFFLHLRDCSSCQEDHAQLKMMFEMLDTMPACEVPADFDDAILASVPYASYKEMEPLRRERVPVYLEEHFLPQLVRSRVTRWSGLGVTVASVAATFALNGPAWLPAAAAVGLVPELLVRMQGLGRRVVAMGSARRAES